MAQILVIDDERSIRNTLKDILEYEEHHVDLAEDGASGIDLFKQNKYDLVLCDIKMPEMDGVELTKAAKHLRPDIDIIVITGTARRARSQHHAGPRAERRVLRV